MDNAIKRAACVHAVDNSRQCLSCLLSEHVTRDDLFISQLMTIRLFVTVGALSCIVSALVDSGAADCFISAALAKRLWVLGVQLATPQRVNAVNGCPLQSRCITCYMRLPLHLPCDCAIDLLSGAMPPRGKAYPFSMTKSAAMETYISAEPKGFIPPSSSPALTSFFFVLKKEGDLCPCIEA